MREDQTCKMNVQFCFRITSRQIRRGAFEALFLRAVQQWTCLSKRCPAAERFLQARNWARVHGIPRFVSYRVPVERKPAYLDFDSPIFVDIFSKMIRRTVDATLPGAMVDLSEMLLLFDQIWLAWKPDANRTA
jgi:hypothetical protein